MTTTDGELIKTIQNVFQAKEVFISKKKEARIASNIKEAIVKLNDETTLHVHVKECLHGSTTASVNELLKIFDREIFVYAEVLPMLIEFQEKKQKEFSEKLDIKSLFFKYYGSDVSNGKDVIIMLERFFPEDYFVTAPEQFFTLQQIHYCMEKIAIFHATSFAMSLKNGISWKNYHPLLQDVLFHPESKAVSEPFFINNYRNNLKILCAIKEETQKRNALVKDCVLSFSSLSSSVLDRLKNIAPHLSKVLYKTLDCPENLAVITHGDFHMWNIAFSNKGKMDTKFFDFQLTRVSSGLVDIHHLLSQACTPSTRNNHLYKFLETYCKAFKSMCLHLGLKEEDILYTKETINKEYALRSPWGFAFGFCFILPRFLSKEQLSLDFYKVLDSTNGSSEIVDLLLKKCSPNIWNVLDMYADMVQMEEDLGTLEIMEKLAAA